MQDKIFFHEINNNYCKIDIPEKAIIGKEFTVKIDKKVPFIELEIGNGIETYTPSRLTDPYGKERPIASIFLSKKAENTDKITVILENISLQKGEKFNTLTPEKLLVSVRAFGPEANHEECIVKEVESVNG